ncbi:MAG: TlpA family protein disulfide reductase [Candidatus Kapabacteria bacterium]|nr:TlpA family protein disulfide reductase [Candidatus Kapabacteria bacterium]
MIRSLLLILALCLAPFQQMAGVPVAKLRDLEQRYANGGDTTYVVNLWATWCKPCVAELPWFEKLHRDDGALGPIKVLLVTLDAPNTIESVERFIERKGLTAEVVVLDEGKPHKWIDRVDTTWSGSIPATLLVRKNGTTRAFYEREFTYDELRTTISTFLWTTPR